MYQLQSIVKHPTSEYMLVGYLVMIYNDLNENCPPETQAFEHPIPSWWHCMGRPKWCNLAEGSISMGKDLRA